ncbi:diacylglycerol/lipid kinase family protein [Vagococcus elongatus]|uniref:diacylglycerol/lipid kinase family protein n=1 Tax=Vagococcus elongatus TaxID=180344 RepID=UPI001FEA8D13|nr:YegS/Rv2252/BmrU family lipid kinase [Vagococcus elongatus]
MSPIKKFIIYFNSSAGNSENNKIAERVQEIMSEHGHLTDILTRPTVEKALNALNMQIPHYDGIIAIGGDGTLNVVATAFIQAGKSIPLGIIPGGTINNFARRWKISLDVDKAVETILKGQTKKVGIGACNNQKAIVSSFTIGVLADISNDVRQQEKKKFGLIVYPLAAFKKIGRNKSHAVILESDHKKETMKTWIALITTTDSVGGIKYLPEDTNGFHVSILHDMGFKKLTSFLRYAFTGHLKKVKSVTYFDSKHIKLIASNEEDKIYSRIDGDASLALPLDLDWKKDFLTLFVPE